MSLFLKLTGTIGLLLFTLLFSLTWAFPDAIANSAKSFVKAQIAEEVRARYQNSPLNSVADKATHLSKRLGLEENRLQQALSEGLPARISTVLASLCGYMRTTWGLPLGLKKSKPAITRSSTTIPAVITLRAGCLPSLCRLK